MNEETETIPTQEGASEAGPAHHGPLHQFISFRVGDEEFAIDIMAVREIKGWTNTAPLPNQPDYNLGVLNLRGTIVPTFDLRCRFGMGRTKTTPFHVVIIVTVQERTMGLLVDAVSDILTVGEDQIRPVPDMDRIAAAEFLSGIIPVEENMVVLLSLEKLFQRGELGSSTEAAA